MIKEQATLRMSLHSGLMEACGWSGTRVLDFGFDRINRIRLVTALRSKIFYFRLFYGFIEFALINNTEISINHCFVEFCKCILRLNGIVRCFWIRLKKANAFALENNATKENVSFLF